MKKLKYLSLLIAFLLGGIFYPLYCKAEALPIPDSGTLSTIVTMHNDLTNVGFVPNNIIPYTDISTSSWSPWSLGYTVLSQVSENDIKVSLCTQEEKEILMQSYIVVDSNGDLLSSSDNIYHLTYDNGYFTGDCYIDSNGKLLGYTNDTGGKLLQAKYGGNVKDTTEWANMFASESSDIKTNQFTINPDNINPSQYSFYLFFGDQTGSTRYAEGLYIANQYIPGVIVPTTSSNGSSIKSWYTNNLNLIVKINPQNIAPFNYDSVYKVNTGTYSKNGATYKYQVIYRNSSEFGGLTFGDSYQAWINWTSNGKWFYRTGYWYNSTLANDASSSNIPFKPLQLPQDTTVINYNTYYTQADISELMAALNDLKSAVNTSYNNSQSVSATNYPIYYPTTVTDVGASSIPFPTVGTDNPPVEYDPTADPTITNPYPDVNPSLINNTIPIISGLQNKFPFSIPWDIYNLINGLSVPREIPVLSWQIEIPLINYTWEPEIDLTMYDSTATLFRTLFLILFIIGLAVFSYNHFFGS